MLRPDYVFLVLVRNLAMEQAWFKDYLPSLDTARHASIHALIHALDVIMDRHIKESWIPRAMKLLLDDKQDKMHTYAALGADLAQQSMDLFWKKFEVLVSTLLDTVIFAIDHYMNDSGIQNRNSLSKQEPRKQLISFSDMHSREMQDFQFQANAIANAEKRMEAILHIVLRMTRDCFSEPAPPFQRFRKLIDQCGQQVTQWLSRLWLNKSDDSTLDLSNSNAILVLNWGRYPHLRNALVHGIDSHIREHWSSTVQAQITDYVQGKLKMEPGVDISSKPFRDEVVHGLLCIIMRKLFVPLLDKDAIVAIIRDRQDWDTLLTERMDYRDAREEISQKIAKLNTSYRQLQEVSGLMGAGLACQ